MAVPLAVPLAVLQAVSTAVMTAGEMVAWMAESLDGLWVQK